MIDQTASKLELAGERAPVSAEAATKLLRRIFRAVGCTDAVAQQVAEHLVDSNLCGVESHGVMRALQYVEQFESGYMRVDGIAKTNINEQGAHEIDGNKGIGIPAMQLAIEHGCTLVKDTGICAMAVRNVGHTGRLGAFAEYAANAGCLTIMIGGGNRQSWRQVAPHGGRRPMLPTNPYCISIPGGERGPVVLDFATSKIAGGWIYAARSAGAQIPADSLIDADGNPSRDPEDYFRGGAILPAGGAKGYALAVMAELIGEAMLGPATTEANWLIIMLDVNRYRDSSTMRAVSEDILAELRDCPPAPDFERVEIPGEREREACTTANEMIAIPERTWHQLNELDARLKG